MTTAEPPTFLKPGTRLGAFRIQSWKGGGSYGDVYKARQDGRPVALKLCKHRQSSDDPGKADQRMLQELVCLVRLDHPHIAKVLGWMRTDTGHGYLVLEYVDGWTLAEWLHQARPTFRQVVRLFAKLADALEYMHHQGVRHRDISLSNVMVRKVDGEPVIIDLGAGEYSGALELTDAPLPPGTHRYRSPEAARFFKEHRDDPGARYDFQPEEDFFALAVCLYDALTDAEPALQADARKAPRINVNSPTLAPPTASSMNPRVPQPLSAWVERWLERDVQKRLPALALMRGTLEEWGEQDGAEWQAPVQPLPEAHAATPEGGAAPWRGRRRRALTGALTAAVLAVGAFLLLREPSSREDLPELAASTPRGAPSPEAPAKPPSPPTLPSAVPSPAELPTDPKESPSVSVPKSASPGPVTKKPKKSSSAFSPEFLKKCALTGAGAAALMGCPGSQVRPERESCPAEAVRAMKSVNIRRNGQVFLLVDVKYANSGDCKRNSKDRCVAVVGDGEVVGEFTSAGGWLPRGTLVYGRLWTGGNEVVGRYTRAVVPAGATSPLGDPLPREIPICLALVGLNGGVEKVADSRPGASMVSPESDGRWVFDQWP